MGLGFRVYCDYLYIYMYIQTENERERERERERESERERARERGGERGGEREREREREGHVYVCIGCFRRGYIGFLQGYMRIGYDIGFRN